MGGGLELENSVGKLLVILKVTESYRDHWIAEFGAFEDFQVIFESSKVWSQTLRLLVLSHFKMLICDAIDK